MAQSKISTLRVSGSLPSSVLAKADAAGLELSDLDGILDHVASSIKRVHGGTNFTNADAGHFTHNTLSLTGSNIDISQAGGRFSVSSNGVLESIAGTGKVKAATKVSLDSASGDISFQDAGVDQIVFDIDGTAGAVIMKAGVDADRMIFSQFDGTEVLGIEDDASLKIAGGAGSTGVTVSAAGNLDVDGISTLGATTGATVSAAGLLNVNNSTEATSATDGSLQTDGGLSVVKSAVIGDDLDLLSDAAIFKVGDSQPFTLTHANANNTLLASANHRLAFGNAGEYIYGDATDLKIISSGDVDVTATLLDVTGAGAFSGNLTVAGNLDVNGTTTTVDTTNMSIQDNIIGLGVSGSGGYAVPSYARGIIFGSGLLSDAQEGFWHGGSGANYFNLGRSATSPTSGSFAGSVDYSALRLGAVQIDAVGNKIEIVASNLKIDAVAHIDLVPAGGSVKVTGDLTPVDDDARDLGTNALQWRNLYIDGTANLDTVDIDAGAIDGTVIGGAAAANGTFLALDCTDKAFAIVNLDINGGGLEPGLADADEFAFYDATASANKKTTALDLAQFIHKASVKKAELLQGGAVAANTDIAVGFNLWNASYSASNSVLREVYVNGQLQREAATNANDCYPGSAASNIKFSFALVQGDLIQIVLRGTA